jgi:kynurenine formamidase
MKYIDLTLPYDENIAGFSSETARTVEKDGWNACTLHFYSHAGTHMDAPFHFGVSSETIDEYPLSTFMTKRAWVVNLSKIEAKSLIFIKDLGEIAQKFKKGDSLLLRTDWSKRLGTEGYRNDLPRISRELAEWCVAKNVQILGIEPPSVADVNNLAEVTEIHHILLRGGIVIVEGLTNLDKIEKSKVELIALPLKIKKGDGAPCRVVAIEKEL